MNFGFTIGILLLLFQNLRIAEVEAKAQCSFYSSPGNNTTSTIQCSDECCSAIAASIDTACCSNISWSALAIPFFLVAAVCFFAICCIYCRPLWKTLLCDRQCPCMNRAQVHSANSLTSHDSPVRVINNDGLPDYETVTKDPSLKDTTPPPYTFVTAHPGDFGIVPRVPSAPPQYASRRNSLSSVSPIPPVQT